MVEAIVEDTDAILNVGPMMDKDATALFGRTLKKLQQNVDQDDLVRLARELDFMPLAVTQAAAYINQLDSMSVSQYLDRLARGDLDRETLLQKDIRDPRRDGRASNSIIVTWHTTFERIRQVQPSAARLLALMISFDREGIPEAFCRSNMTKVSNRHVGRQKQMKLILRTTSTKTLPYLECMA